jgi:nucleotide-binding universal stress UspA family protein
MTPPRTIVIGYDASQPARAAIEAAGALFRLQGAVVACVWAPIEGAVPAATVGAPGGVALVGARRLDAAEQSRAERVAGEGAEVASRHDGPPWRALVDCAAELDAAAIVTGTRSRSRAAAAVLGSTAEGVLRHAHRPVFVVSGR